MNTLQDGTLAPRLHISLGSGTTSVVTVTPTTESTSTTTGSVLVNGGLGVVKSIYTNGQININREELSSNAVLDTLVLEHTRSDGAPAQTWELVSA